MHCIIEIQIEFCYVSDNVRNVETDKSGEKEKGEDPDETGNSHSTSDDNDVQIVGATSEQSALSK